MLLDLLPQLGDEDKGTSLPGLYFPHNFIMKNFKHTENLKEFYSDYSHPHQLRVYSEHFNILPLSHIFPCSPGIILNN